MKKLMIAGAIAAMAIVSQAATFNWQTTSNFLGIDATAVTDNGSYGTSGNLKGSGSYTYILTLYTQGTEDVVGSATGAVKFNAANGRISVNGIEIANAQAGTTYDYTIFISGTNNKLTARGIDGDYDYSNAKMDTTVNGSVEAVAGSAKLESPLATGWNVSGITAAPGPIPPGPAPEPTSGLLMLLGVAGLALRRKQK